MVSTPEKRARDGDGATNEQLRPSCWGLIQQCDQPLVCERGVGRHWQFNQRLRPKLTLPAHARAALLAQQLCNRTPMRTVSFRSFVAWASRNAQCTAGKSKSTNTDKDAQRQRRPWPSWRRLLSAAAACSQPCPMRRPRGLAPRACWLCVPWPALAPSRWPSALLLGSSQPCPHRARLNRILDGGDEAEGTNPAGERHCQRLWRRWLRGRHRLRAAILVRCHMMSTHENSNVQGPSHK